MSCFLIPVPPDPLSHMNLSSRPPILPGAGPSLVRWIKDVSDGVMTSAATQRAEISLKCMLENLNHACIAQIFLAYSCSKWCCHGICWRRAFWLVNIASFRDLLSSRNWLKSILSQFALKGILALIIVVCKSFQRQFDPCFDVKYIQVLCSSGIRWAVPLAMPSPAMRHQSDPNSNRSSAPGAQPDFHRSSWRTKVLGGANTGGVGWSRCGCHVGTKWASWEDLCVAAIESHDSWGSFEACNYGLWWPSWPLCPHDLQVWIHLQSFG